jgi:hypothetical protein
MRYCERLNNFKLWGEGSVDDPYNLCLCKHTFSGDRKTKEYLLEKYNIKAFRRNKHVKQLEKKIIKDKNLICLPYLRWYKIYKLRDLDARE